MITTINGINSILFKNGELFFNGIQIKNDISFEFNINKPEEKEQYKDTSILEINVHDSVSGKDLGPGQKR